MHNHTEYGNLFIRVLKICMEIAFLVPCSFVRVCVYGEYRVVYYHLCNLTTAENLTLGCGSDLQFLTWTIQVLSSEPACFIGKNSTMQKMMKCCYLQRKSEFALSD